VKDRLRRELSFQEWRQLSSAQKRRIMNQHWDPTRPKLGERTRGAILEGFGASYPRLLERAVAGTAFFSRVGWSIAVVVEDPSVRVPRSFDVFPVVKGLTKDQRFSWKEVEWQAR
jgi:hypothetical protein